MTSEDLIRRALYDLALALCQVKDETGAKPNVELEVSWVYHNEGTPQIEIRGTPTPMAVTAADY